MKKEEFIKLARESGFVHGNPHSEIIIRHSSGAWVSIEEMLHRFAILVAATEREACAITAWSAGMDAHNEARGLPCDARNVGSKAAKSIRARSKK